jgi:RNA polymerase sigma factor (sigma-70 family)
MRRKLTRSQQRLVEEALPIVPKALASIRRAYPGIREALERIDAESLAHLALCRAALTYDPTKSKPTTYFSAAIRNQILKEVERHRKQAERIAKARELAGTQSPADAVQAGTLQNAISCLPDEHARLIRQRFREGKSLSQIAEAEGCTRSTVRRRLLLATRLLRAALGIQTRPPGAPPRSS